MSSKTTVRGFTLVELLVTVALLGMVVGMVVGFSSGAEVTSETKMIQAELAEIRKACQRFKLDMGEAPEYLAELFRSPDPAVTGGGWVWRSTATTATPAKPIDARLYSFDPATGRGWNGPYLQTRRADSLWPDPKSQAQHLGTRYRDRRIVSVSGTPSFETYDFAIGNVSDLPPILLSHYVTQAQDRVIESDGTTTNYSHYELDFSDTNGEISVVFISNPETAPSANVAVARLGLGIKP